MEKTGEELLVIETALMFETGCDSLCDEVWLVTADEEVRIERLKQNRGYSEEKSKSIIAAQVSDDEIIDWCAVTINNNYLLQDVSDQLDRVL